jgi:type IV fimbrial biogenesis protein FimT
VDKKKCDGFSFIELMITVVVTVVLATIAIPSFWNMIQANRVTAEANGLVSALTYARSEAVKRGERVSFCPSDGEQPTPACGENWANGWLVFINPDGTAEPDADDILRSWEPLPDSLTLVLDVANAPSQTRVDFANMGNVDQAAQNNFRFRWNLQPNDCAEGRPMRRTVDVSSVGRAQVTSENC